MAFLYTKFLEFLYAMITSDKSTKESPFKSDLIEPDAKELA